MAVYVLKRLAYMVFALVGVLFVTFWMMRLAPGNFFSITQYQNSMQLAGFQQMNPGIIQAWVQRWGLGLPWYEQFWRYLRDIGTMHLGTSFEYPETPTLQIIERTFPVSLLLAVLGVAVAVAVSIPLGIIAAMKRNTWVDSGTMFVSMTGHAIPNYVLAVLFILIFSLWLKVLPVIGWGKPKDVIMPVLALALPMVGSMSRYMRSSLVDNLRREYVTGVIAGGGSSREVIFGHALRNSLIPLVTVVGPTLAGLMVGTVFIEQIFGIPGLGSYFTTAAQSRDYPMIMDSTFFYAALVMLMNLVVDLAYGVLDPRTRRR